jgi:HlyD family secretion protein
MGRIVSLHALARAALGAGLVFALVLVVDTRALALDAPAGSTNPATTKPAPDKDQSPDKEGKDKPTTAPSSSSESATQPARQPGPNGQFVKKGDLSLEVRTEGMFQPADAYELKPVFKGWGAPMTITSIAQPGQKVKKGDPLLECDTTSINWALTQAESELNAAKALLQKAASDVALGEIGDQMALKAQQEQVKIAEEGKKWFDEVDGPQMLRRQDLQVKQQQNSVDDQNDELDQLRKMYKDEELTSATADIVVRRAVRSLENGKIALKMQEQVREKVKQFDYPISKQRVYDAVDGAKQQLALLKAQQAQIAVTRQSGLTGAKVAFEQATRKLADLKEDLNWFTVKSPCDGVVAYGAIMEGQWVGGDPKALKPGEKIAPGQVVLRVFTPGKMRVVLTLPESQAFWVEPGMKARITPAAAPQRSYVAKCREPEVLPRGTPPTIGFQLTLDAGDVDPRLLPGMRANVTIDAGRVEDALLVPVAAVTAGKVKVRDTDGHVSEHDVQVGKSDGNQIEIRKGLQEGDEIVLPGKKG